MGRKKVLEGLTYRSETACGSMYTIINGDVDECFINLGKSGTCARAFTEALGRATTIACSDRPKKERIEKLLKSIKGIRCGSASDETPSCIDSLARVLEEHIKGVK